MATGGRGQVAINDQIELETKDKETKEEAEKESKDECNKEAAGSSIKKEENLGKSAKNEENRRKSSDFWLLWPEPSTRASMARFSFLLFYLRLYIVRTRVSRSPCYNLH